MLARPLLFVAAMVAASAAADDGDEAQVRSVRIGEKGAVEHILYWVEPPDWR